MSRNNSQQAAIDPAGEVAMPLVSDLRNVYFDLIRFWDALADVSSQWKRSPFELISSNAPQEPLPAESMFLRCASDLGKLRKDIQNLLENADQRLIQSCSGVSAESVRRIFLVRTLVHFLDWTIQPLGPCLLGIESSRGPQGLRRQLEAATFELQWHVQQLSIVLWTLEEGPHIQSQLSAPDPVSALPATKPTAVSRKSSAEKFCAKSTTVC